MKKKQKILLGWFVCFLGALFYCYEYLLRVSPSVMSKQLMSFYHLDAARFGDLQAYYYYIYVPMQLIVGILFDRFGPRRLLSLAVLACGAGIYIFAHTHVFYMAAFGRLLMGFGSAFAFVGVLKLATIWLPPERFAFVSGIAVALGMVGGILGDVALTSLVTVFGWKLTCVLAALFGLLLALLMFVFVRDRNPHAVRDMQDIHLHGVKLAWPDMVKIVANPQFWINGIIGCLLYLPLSAFAELWAIPFLKEAHHFTASHAADTSSMIFAGWAIGGPIVGWISDFLGQRRILITIGSVGAAVVVASILYVPNLSTFGVFALFFLYGMFASAQVLAFAIAREISPKTLTGTALASTNMIVMLGGFLVPVIGWILDLCWQGTMAGGVQVYSLANFQVALSLLPIGLVISAVLSFFLKETHCIRHEC